MRWPRTNAPVAQRQMVTGENHMRPQFIQFNRCRNVLIEDVKIRNSPFWTTHLLLCENSLSGHYFLKANGLASDISNILITQAIIESN